ncbi:Formin-like protein 11 [Linum grandiflorum]
MASSSASSFCSHILLLIIFMLISSLQSAHVSAKDGVEKQIQKVSGEDESEKGGQTVIVLQKFRALLKLPWIQHFPPSPPSSENWAPAPAPALAPQVPFRLHSHPPPLHHQHRKPIPVPEVQEKAINNKGRFRRVLVAVIVSSGAAALVVTALLLTWAFSGKFRKQHQTESSKWRKKSRYVASRSPGNKVSLNPGLDFLYLNSLCRDSELEETSCRKQAIEVLKPPHYSSNGSPNCVLAESVSSSSTRDIISVHGCAEEHESEGENSCVGDKTVRIECHSSDDESFHSFAGSHSSSIRLSNASASSPLNEPNVPPPPPPPPPRPYLPRISPPSESLWRSKRSTSTFPDLSSPRGMSCSSLGSKNTPGKDLPPLPQKSASGIPPPPCPPPFLKGNSISSSSQSGPPPPPPSQLPLGKDGTPLPKLKPLHWDKVRAPPDQRMVWDKIRSNSFELDEEMIESLFGYHMRSITKTDDTNGCKTPSPSSKHVLDPKRLQNITILSKAMNSTADQVCDSLMRGAGLCLQQLEALERMAPTNEEQLKLCEYKGNINELGSAEIFVKTLLTVPFAFDRVEAMLFRETFEDEVVHLRNSFSMLEEACKELRSSRLFLKLLETVLKTGNRMNVGTIRGDARAFKLDALLKLSDVKGTDGKTTLFHFVVQEISRTEGVRVSDSIIGTINQQNSSKPIRTADEKEENYRRLGLDLVSGLSNELYNVKKTATVDMDVLATSVSNLSTGIAKVNHLIGNQLCGGEFVSSMKGFLHRAEAELKEVEEEEDRVMSMVREVTEYFHGNVGKDEANPLRIFVIVRDFLGMLDHVCKELRSSKTSWSSNPFR